MENNLFNLSKSLLLNLKFMGFRNKLEFLGIKSIQLNIKQQKRITFGLMIIVISVLIINKIRPYLVNCLLRAYLIYFINSLRGGFY